MTDPDILRTKIDRRRELGPRCKPVRILGMTFPTVSEAARQVGANEKNLCALLSAGKPLGQSLHGRFEALLSERMAEAAKASNAAMRRKMGVGAQGYTRRKPTTDAGTMQSLVLAAATDEPMTTSQLAKKAGTGLDATRKAVQRLAKRGQLVQAETIRTSRNGGWAKTYRRAG